MRSDLLIKTPVQKAGLKPRGRRSVRGMVMER